MEASADAQHIDYSPRRISELATQLSENLTTAIEDIQNVNDMTKIISINAKITAARAGDAGRAFGIVADEVMRLSQRTALVAKSLHDETNGSIEELNKISNLLDTFVRGQRLSIYARTNIDLIDRNLYERSCDVRWWATDTSLVEALTNPTYETLDFASHRLGVILSAYTVYYDLVLADTEGNIVANGRPDHFTSQGRNVANESWFQQAISSSSGDDYGLQSVHTSYLVNNYRSLIYSCGVREDGKSDGKVIGALGIIFNWDGLAQTIVESTPIDEEEWPISRACITDSNGRILADTGNRQLQESLSFEQNKTVFSSDRGFVDTTLNGKRYCVAYSGALGFETYNSGWHSIIMQET